MSAPNLDYPSGDERMRAMEKGLTELGVKVDALTDGAAEVVTELKNGAQRMEGIERKVDRVAQSVSADPGGLTNHEIRLRDLERDRDRHNGAGWWRPIAAGVAIAVVSALLTFGATKLASSLQSQADKTAALCTTKFQSLDAAKARGTYTDRQARKQEDVLISQGCIR